MSGDDCAGRAYFEELFVFFALFWPFSRRTLYFVRMLLRMSLIFQRSLPTPLSSPPTHTHTPDKHTIWILLLLLLPFNSSSESKPQPPATAEPTNSSSPCLMGSCSHHFNWLDKLDPRMKEFIDGICFDKRIHRRQCGCRMNQKDQAHHHQENKQENKHHHQGEDRSYFICFI